MRTRAVARVEVKMNVVSERLNCRASACCVASSRPAPSSNTHNGFPVRRPSRAKTLTMRYAKLFIVWPFLSFGGVEVPGGEALQQLRVHASESAVGHHQHLVARPHHTPQRLDHGLDVMVDRGARGKRRQRLGRIPAEVAGIAIDQ